MDPSYPAHIAVQYANRDLVKKGKNPADFDVKTETQKDGWHVVYQDKKATRGGTIEYVLDKYSGEIMRGPLFSDPLG